MIEKNKNTIIYYYNFLNDDNHSPEINNFDLNVIALEEQMHMTKELEERRSRAEEERKRLEKERIEAEKRASEIADLAKDEKDRMVSLFKYIYKYFLTNIFSKLNII
jgi:hypothetical protein